MESTGIYWKSPYAALEAAGIRAKVVNARPLSKQVPERKTDIGDGLGTAWVGYRSRGPSTPQVIRFANGLLRLGQLEGFAKKGSSHFFASLLSVRPRRDHAFCFLDGDGLSGCDVREFVNLSAGPLHFDSVGFRFRT